MNSLRSFFVRLISVFRSSRFETDLRQQLEAHRELIKDELIRGGSDPTDAEFAARKAMGNELQVRELASDERGFPFIDDLRADLSYAIRQFGRNRTVTLVCIVTLGLGIGANTAIFSLVNTVMLRKLPVREPGQLVELLSRYPGEPRLNAFSWKYYEHFRDQNHVFSELVGVSRTSFQVSRSGAETETIDAEYVMGDFFPVLGLNPVLGRLISPQDDQPDTVSAAVAVVSWSYWKNRFNLDPGILGKQIVVNSVSTTVIGVTPPEFLGLDVGARREVWVPVAMGALIQPPDRRLKDQMEVTLVGRLKPGVSIIQARAEMSVLDRWRVDDMVKGNKDPRLGQLKIEVEPAASGLSRVRDVLARPLLILMFVVILLLLIACTNVAGMMLARAAARRQEMALRISLGAGRLRLVRHVLTEAVLLSAVGGVVGLLLAWTGTDALVRIIARGRLTLEPIAINVEPDMHVLLFAAAVALLAGVLCGLAPALYASQSAPANSLRENGRTGATRSRRLFGKSLVVAQVALSLALLSSAWLFADHLSRLRGPELGFQRDSVLLVDLNPSVGGYRRSQLSRPYQGLLERLEEIPGVRAATLSGTTPISGAGASRFVEAEGFQQAPEERRYVSLNWVAPKYFATFGTPLVGGRDFQFEDAGRPLVAIVNQAMARHYFRDGRPIGKHVNFLGEVKSYEIVGMVGDAKYLVPTEIAPPTIYLNAFQDGRIFSSFALRTSVAPEAVVGEVRRAVRDVLKTVPVDKVTTLAVQVDAAIVPERLIAMLSEMFAASGAALAAIGLYGLLAYTVDRRTNEIGIRMALGATRGDVTRMVLKGALGLVCTGLVMGLPIAFWSKRFASSLVENLPTESTFPLSFAASAMIAVAMLAAYVPARRAARVDPMKALRQD